MWGVWCSSSIACVLLYVRVSVRYTRTYIYIIRYNIAILAYFVRKGENKGVFSKKGAEKFWWVKNLSYLCIVNKRKQQILN